MAECITCRIEEQKREWKRERYEAVKRSAQEYARQQKKTVAIYREGIEWKFTEAGTEGITAHELVSQY